MFCSYKIKPNSIDKIGIRMIGYLWIESSDNREFPL